MTHNQLGLIHESAGDLDRAMTHFREGIRFFEAAGHFYNAARARLYAAFALARAGRFADAREYALAALRNFEAFGDRAAEDIENTRGLIAAIEEVTKGGKQ